MRAELINPFLNATINVLRTMCQTVPTPGAPILKPSNQTWGAVTGIISMTSPTINGSLVISFQEKTIISIVNKMFAESNSEVTPEIVDAVGEITNMICGGAKQHLGELGHHITMASPVMIRGQGVVIVQHSKAPTIQIPIATPEGSFVIEANLA
jgi:chemotaxis protein CheX